LKKYSLLAEELEMSAPQEIIYLNLKAPVAKLP
jgi:hypothetical protein